MDFVYHDDGIGLTADQAVVRFVTELAPRVEEIVLFGRRRAGPARAPYAIPDQGVRLVALPDYPSVADVRRLARSARGACSIFAGALSQVDVVLLFGPHPLSIAFALLARRRGVPVVLGVRQDFPRYIAGRASRRRRLWAVPAAVGHETAFRLLAHSTPTMVVGEDLARRYGATRRPHVRSIPISLVREADLIDAPSALARDWNGDELRILSVGRLDPEKNPLLLPRILERLLQDDERWRLDVAGDGPLQQAVETTASALGVRAQLRTHGHVANGEELRALYRDANVFLHVSLTEGLPQVLFEAAAAGLPIVATDVGGVGAALAGGDPALLVPPDDVGAATRALRRLRDEPELRAAAISHVLGVAGSGTMEHGHEELLRLLRAAVTTSGGRAS